MKQKYFLYFSRVALLFLAYFITATFGLKVIAVSGFATLIWPPTGIAFASLLLFGSHLWPGIFLAAFLVNFYFGAGPFTALGIAAGNTLEALLAVHILLHRTDFRKSLDRLKDVVLYVFVACILSCLVDATIGNLCLGLGGSARDGFWATWRAWWTGDAFGGLIVGPFILVWGSYNHFRWRFSRVLEIVCCILIFLAASALMFTGLNEVLNLPALAHLYFLFPFVLWIAIRFDQIGNVTALLLVSAIAIWGTAHGYGPFSAIAPAENFFLLHSFLTVIAITGLTVAAVFTERRQAIIDRERSKEELKKSHDKLETLFLERTDTLQKTETRLSLLVDSVKDYAIFMLDLDGKVATWNEGAKRINKYEAADIIGRHFSIFFTQEDKTKGNPEIELKGALQNGRFEIEDWRLRRDGSTFWAHIVLTVVKDRQNNPVGFAKVTRDLTERRRMESEVIRANQDLEKRISDRTAQLQAVLESQQFLSQASLVLNSSLEYEKTLQSLANLVVSKMADWCLVNINFEGNTPITIALAHPVRWKQDLVKNMLHKFPTNWNGENGAPHVIKSGKSEIYSEIPDALLVKVAQNEEHLKILRDLGMKSAMIAPISVRDKILGTITFISSSSLRYEHFNLEIAEELGRRAGIAIENAILFQKAQSAIAARDEFLSIASHELKTPLTSLKLQAQLRKRDLLRGGDASFFAIERIEKLVKDDERQINRLSNLIDDMLDITRLNTGKLYFKPEEVELLSLVKECVERFSYQLQAAGCEISISGGENIVAHWDRFRIEQVLLNLLTNAMKYGAKKSVEIEISQNGSSALISVTDHGIGIAKEDQERIFQRFERAAPEKGISGLGLGLYIARQIVEGHGGALTVESELECGSTFTVTLPLFYGLAQHSAH